MRIMSECCDSRGVDALRQYYQGELTPAQLAESLKQTRGPNEECDCFVQSEEGQKDIVENTGIFYHCAEQNCRSLKGADMLASIALKERIYWLKEHEGLSSAEACRRLGYPVADRREYGHIARHLLHVLGISAVKLETSNPRKVRGLESHGVKVTRIPHRVGVTPQNRDYVLTKVRQLGHYADGV